MKAVLLIFLFLTIRSLSQTEPRPAIDQQALVQGNVDDINKSVTGITPTEETLIVTVEQDYAQAIVNLYATNNLDDNAIQNETHNLRVNRDTKIQSILTIDQYVQYLKMEGRDERNWKGNPNTKDNKYN
jgi:hypothetical protein